MSSTTNTSERIDLQAAAMGALFREEAEKKAASVKEDQQALEENRSRLDQLVTQIAKQPLTLVANRWSSYFNHGQMLRWDKSDDGEYGTLRVYHPWVASYFDHSPKKEWTKLYESMAPTPLLTVTATRTGYEASRPGQSKPKQLTDIGAVLTLVVEVLTDNGVTVKDSKEE